MRQAFEQMDKAFATADEAMNRAFNAPKPSPNPGHIRINFINRRWATFSKFLGCAFEILFTGKTTLVVKKR